MGNIQNYCCPDGSDETEDEQEEQSRFLSEIASNNQQYGACEQPKPPTIYKIVLPKLIPIDIENHELDRPAAIKEEYCAEQFEHLRSLILKTPDDQNKFRELLWSCIPWSAPGGKSGSTFLKTVNDQFILKEMSKLELQSFLSIANEYFNYVETSYNDNKLSLLSTIFGIYRIVYTSNPAQTGVEYYFMVMKNLFYKRNISQRFDLKGSVRNRLTDTSDPDKNEHVLMDENLLRIACDHPLFIHARSKQILNECIENDSRFLASIGVMDYSLLVGVDKENQELVLGIIDYVRPFTWDKKLERVVKSVVSSELPTILEPRLYRERFCEAMDKYFETPPPPL
jgi:1-phosphatidylinositol-3-phosphate 5-kinase